MHGKLRRLQMPRVFRVRIAAPIEVQHLADRPWLALLLQLDADIRAY